MSQLLVFIALTDKKMLHLPAMGIVSCSAGGVSAIYDEFLTLDDRSGFKTPRFLFTLKRFETSSTETSQYSCMDEMTRYRDITVSAEYIRFIMNSAARSGIDPDAVYADAGFPVENPVSAGARIPFDRFQVIWNALEERSPDPDLGLHLGENACAFPGHILFPLIWNAPTIQTAIENFCRYFNLMNDINAPSLTIRNNRACLSIRFFTDTRQRTRHIHEGILAAYTAILRQISENRIRLEGVYFTHPCPKDISEHRRIFDAPLFFDQKENMLVFPKENLSLPVPFSDGEVLDTLEKLAQNLQRKLCGKDLWRDKVCRMIMEKLKGETPEIESIARRLAMSPRNLQRQLKKEGTTYRQLLDHVKKEQAIVLLEQTEIPISEIAFHLGYSEQSAFNRAFKRWTGATPGQYHAGP